MSSHARRSKLLAASRVGRWAAHRLSPRICSYRGDSDWPVMQVDLAMLHSQIMDTLAVPQDATVDILGPVEEPGHDVRPASPR